MNVTILHKPVLMINIERIHANPARACHKVSLHYVCGQYQEFFPFKYNMTDLLLGQKLRPTLGEGSSLSSPAKVGFYPLDNEAGH